MAHDSQADLRVDVVIPLYNNEKDAVGAIASALAQTYPVQRIVVVDDGSTDRSVLQIERNFAGNLHVQVIRSAHKGRSAARNQGIAASDADLIAFLDCDDLWLPEKLERQIALFKKFRFGLCLLRLCSHRRSWKPYGGRLCAHADTARRHFFCIAAGQILLVPLRRLLSRARCSRKAAVLTRLSHSEKERLGFVATSGEKRIF